MMFRTGKCIYCGQPVTWWDWLRGRAYTPSDTTVAHNPCKVEPKAGA